MMSLTIKEFRVNRMNSIFLKLFLFSLLWHSSHCEAGLIDEIFYPKKNTQKESEELIELFNMIEREISLSPKQNVSTNVRDDSRSQLEDGMIYDEDSGVCVHIDDVPHDQRISGQ